jgi:hypothetical protein
MIDEETKGKIAAHAYVDETQRLNLGYAALIEKAAQDPKMTLPDVTKGKGMIPSPGLGDILKKLPQVPPMPKK